MQQVAHGSTAAEDVLHAQQHPEMRHFVFGWWQLECTHALQRSRCLRHECTLYQSMCADCAACWLAGYAPLQVTQSLVQHLNTNMKVAIDKADDAEADSVQAKQQVRRALRSKAACAGMRAVLCLACMYGDTACRHHLCLCSCTTAPLCTQGLSVAQQLLP